MLIRSCRAENQHSRLTRGNENRMDIKCYFYIAEDQIKVMCVECYKNHQQGWLWTDSLGEKEIKCSICGKIINKFSNNVENLC